MDRGKFLAVTVLCAALSIPTIINAAVINFNDAPTHISGGESIGPIYSESGFNVSTKENAGVFSLWDGWQSNRGSSNGTTTGFVYNDLYDYEVHFRVSSNDDSAFSIQSIDLGEVFNENDSSYYRNGMNGIITGVRTDGSIVGMSLQLDGVSDGIGGVEDFETFSFDSDWTNLSYVDFDFTRDAIGYATYINFDNIVVSSVPIPPSLFLFGSGFIGLIGFARRKHNA
ncbi:MAG: hypothetical protein DIZ80_03275 [endosymbiont of Galathealinum brachiosum]|uniref:PEP-CTERM protein-sorting domain-containing protein n=1 Tax=endosymbiont of Galathealinum brachiosum TaxID=2200906 RepID=A0A370DHX6_9GAMM|nr:MAG: hypothetical protein DIZ80_03275 [endosymbiont of Galathealinum brachiosum]